MLEEIIKSTEQRMQKAIDALKKDLAALRTGRANPAIVEHVLVDYYGVPTPLNQIAGITAPEARLLVVQPWDRSAIQAIEKGIIRSSLGLNPANDGQVIRIPIPALTEERRRDMVKQVHKRVEEARVSIRNCRIDGRDEVREKVKTGGGISQDDEKRIMDSLQKLTDAFILQAGNVGEAKEKELLTV